MSISLAVCLCALLSILPWERQGDAPARPVSGAMQALNFLAAQRAYPNDDLLGGGYVEAHDFIRNEMTSDLGVGKSGSGWESLGPHNIGGRTLALAFNPQNPNTIWAASASGGLWRSWTGGVGVSAWHRVETGHPVLGVGSVAIAPNDSNTMYIGTGEVYSLDDTQGGIAVRLTRGSFGIGVLKSEDGGQHWTKSLDWSYDQQRGVQVVKIDPLDPRVVWAGTTEGVYRSPDAGATWDQVNTIAMITDLAIHPTSPDTVFIAAGNLGSIGRGLYRSIDGGANWDVIDSGVAPLYYEGKALLSICESEPNTIYVSIGNGGSGANATWLIRSHDAGDTWELCTTTDYSIYQGWFSHDVAVHPQNPNEVLAVGIDVWKSTNYGVTLTKKSDWAAWYFGQTPPGGPEGPSNYSHADHHDIVYHPTDPNIVYFANDGGIFRSLDGGETFEGCNGGYQTQQFYAGFSCSLQDSNLAIGGMQDNATAIYTGTDAWIRVIGGDGSATAIDAADDNVIYGSAQYLYLLRSRDRGAHWDYIAPPETGETSFIAPFGLGGPAEPDVVYACRNYVYKSVNEGDTWTTTNSGYYVDQNPGLGVAVSQSNSDLVYMTTAPVFSGMGVFKTENGGAFWTEITNGLPNRYPVGLAIDPNNDQCVWVTLSGFGTSHVFKTTDGGDSWQDVGAGLPDVPTSAVIVDPLDSNHVYVGCDLGVFVTLDGGQTWIDFSGGLPEAVMVMDLTIMYGGRILCASTYGNGAYRRPMIGAPCAVENLPTAPPDFVLAPNHPNPFNPRTEIAWNQPVAAQVRLDVFDVAGRRVRTLVNGHREAGRHTMIWDGRDGRGAAVPSGVYLSRLSSGSWHRVRKMQLVR